MIIQLDQSLTVRQTNVQNCKRYLFGVAVVAFSFFLFSSSASMTVVMLALRPAPSYSDVKY